MLRIRTCAITLLATALAVAIVWWRGADSAIPPAPPMSWTTARATRSVSPDAPPTTRSKLQITADWILAHPEIDRGAALAALFNGANAEPDALVRCAEEIIRRDPTLARDCGNQLVFALGAAGEHARAARFAVEAPVALAADCVTAA